MLRNTCSLGSVSLVDAWTKRVIDTYFQLTGSALASTSSQLEGAFACACARSWEDISLTGNGGVLPKPWLVIKTSLVR
jgi:hypothetical protein